MTRPAPVIIGHSHVRALGVPAGPKDDVNVRLSALPRDSRFDCLIASMRRGAPYWDAAVDLAASRPIAICWNGNQHYVGFMFAPRPQLDFALAARPDLPVNEASIIVPELAVREWLASSFGELESLLARIAAAGGPPGVLLGTPPPKGNTEAIRGLLSREPVFAILAERMGENLSTAELSPPILLLKLWLLLQEMMRALADRFGMRFCPSPGDASNAEGYLRDDLWADATHANGDYGPLMLRDLALQLPLGVTEPALQL